MKKSKQKKIGIKVLASVLAIILSIPWYSLNVQAEENIPNEVSNVQVYIANKEVGYSSAVQPLTTIFDCEIIMAFTLEGLEMSFTTSCADIASVIGVKDIKVQQKMWYGWKTVFTSAGAENQNENIFIATTTYPDAVSGKTYRVICTHYADYDGYEEVVNDTGAFKFVL